MGVKKSLTIVRERPEGITISDLKLFLEEAEHLGIDMDTPVEVQLLVADETDHALAITVTY